MSPAEKVKAIQAILGVAEDGIPGPLTETAWQQLRMDSRKSEWRKVKASSFADPADVAAFNRCKATGKTDSECFAVGDNGIGCFGDDTANGPPMVALPPEDMEERWGSISNARHKPVLVAVMGKSVKAIVGDRMPRRRFIKNGAGIDLNPATCALLGLKPPVMVDAAWKWA